ncbi:Spy0128 family protein [Enterococcus sp. DIV0876]|uniref:Spy0128 family protein n=1 Tax=Enterococcus sp. DIV0876 TaxID=2774633 RepID=UPI003D2FE3AA
MKRKMKRKIVNYLSLFALMSSILCQPAIIVAETLQMEESSEPAITQNTQSSTESTAVSSTQQTAVASSLEETQVTVDTAEAKETPSSSDEEQVDEANNDKSIQPRAPNQNQAPSTKEAHNPNLNERGVTLFTNMRVTDLNDQPFTEENPPMINSNVKIHFDWFLEETEDIFDGDYYTYQIPDYFAIHNEVSGELKRSGGQSLGTFSLNKTGELKIVFNGLAESLSKRTGTIDLRTELQITTVSDEVVIYTGIFDNDGQEITITLPIFEIDIAKTGNVNANGAIVWEVIFNQSGGELHDVVVTDDLPEGLAYSSSTGYLYDESTEAWIKTDGLYTYNAANHTFTFHQKLSGAVKIAINTTVTDPTIQSFKNTAVINGSNFTEQRAEATVAYDEQAEYKRFVGYDPETKRASWEVSVSLEKEKANVLDQTYSGSDPEKAVHFFVPETLVIKDKEGKVVPAEEWSFIENYEQTKNGKIVRFGITFAKSGYYKLYYDTQLFDSVLSDTKIYNHVAIMDNENTYLNGIGTVKPNEKIGVTKSAVSKDYDGKTVLWKIEANTQKQKVTDLLIEDRYQLINGTNVSALMLTDSLVVSASDANEPLTLGRDYTITPTTEIKKLTDGSEKEIETGFKIQLIGDTYKTTSAKITVDFRTSFDMQQQNALGSSSNRFSNTAFVHYVDESGRTLTEAREANTWLDTTWLKNALKYGVFLPEGADVAATLKAALNRNIGTIFDQTTASSDQVYWMALFNTYKQTIGKNAVIVDQLQTGQTLREVALYTVSVSGWGTQLKELKEKLVPEKDYIYTYDPESQEVSFTLLRETDETLAVFLSVDAAEDVFTYKNTITLTDQDTTLTAEGQADKSAKTNWLMKNGTQNETNKRLIDWEVMINTDSRKIHNAVVTDSVRYNQQSFLRNEDGQVIVDVYQAVMNNGTWEKGEKIQFHQDDNPKIITDMAAGTQSLVIAFEEMIDTPYFIVYQTQLDPGIQNKEKVANSVSLTGSEIEIHSVTKEITIQSTEGSGSSSGTNGSLAIKKYDIDGDKERGIAEEAVFQLSRKNAQDKYEVIFSNIVVKNNQIIENGVALDRIDNLRYGEYMIQEIAAPQGYQRDDTPYEFTISEDQVDYVFALANKREIKDTSLALSIQKNLEGRTLREKEFIFELLDADGQVLQTQSNGADGQVSFDAITYKEAGDYQYTIQEQNGSDQTIDYDQKKLNVVVHVSDVDGQLKAEAVYDGNQVFTNTYTPKAGSIVLNAEKVLEGRALQTGEFRFELLDSDGEVLQTQSNGADGQVYFDAITYEEAGEYHYTIQEQSGSDQTIDYDQKKLNVVVHVSDVDGQLKAEAVYEGNQVFTNTYTPKAGSIVLNAEKVLEGRALQTGEFRFELLDSDGEVLQTQSNGADGQVYFDAITYKEAGEYQYTIQEQSGSDQTIDYDQKKLNVVVHVSDVDGQLKAEAVYEGNQVFTNIYTPKAGSVVLSAEKVLEGRPLQNGEFTFELLDADSKILQTQSNEADGQVYFDAIAYEEAGEYHYTIQEKAGSDQTIDYDQKKLNVVVHVSDVDGQLKAEAVYDGNQVFTNMYTPKAGSVVLSAEKVLEGRPLQNGEFTFELLDADSKILQTQSNEADGQVYFDAIAYEEVGEYHYTIQEKAGSDQTIDYDQKKLNVVVHVRDVDGQLKAEAVYDGNQVFTNTYTPKAGSIVLSAEKVLEGRTLQNGEFTFELLDEEGEVLQTQSNGADGQVYFDAITYEEAGEYQYTIQEQSGSDQTIDYDQTVYQIVVHVEDLEGTITAEIVKPEKALFTNVVKPSKKPTEKTKKPKNKLPKTGEVIIENLSVVGTIMIFAVLVVYWYRKNWKK